MTEKHCPRTNTDCDRGFNCAQSLPYYPGSCVHALSALIDYCNEQDYVFSKSTSAGPYKLVGYARKIVGGSDVAVATVQQGNLEEIKLRKQTINQLKLH